VRAAASRSAGSPVLSAFFYPRREANPVKDFFETRRFKVLIGVAVFLAGMMAYAGANGRLTAAPQEVLGLMVEPFQWAASHISAGAGAVWDKYTRYDDVVAENEALQAENKELRDQLVDYDRLQAENEAYKSMQQIQQENPSWTEVSAFVIGRDTLDDFGGFTLDAGTGSGVEKGDTVVSNDGYLVGIVQEADVSSCKVLTILHPSFAAASVVSRTRDNGILCGDSAYAAKGECTMTNLSRDTLATVGDQVITTGLGGVFPADVLIGTIGEIVPETSGKSAVAVIEPGADVKTLTHVFVITGY
jgi:rod shape-determining protein MreC